MPILWVFKPTFSFFRKACFLYKTSKIVFLDLFLGSMTWEYRGYGGLQGVTGSDKGLRGVTKGYRGL